MCYYPSAQILIWDTDQIDYWITGGCRARVHTRSNAPTIYLIYYRLIVQYVRTCFVLYKHTFLMREYTWSIRAVLHYTTRFMLYNHTFLMREYAWTLRTGAHDDASR